jgi:alkanesulfonate monooxygenase SsuD/methylene tetrahydromethanopterin reductase-like flavin-dependent oxidoreductase (luciferase family)
MRFGCVQEAYFPPGSSVPERYLEMVEEAVLAERWGFDTYCLSEQHFGVADALTQERAGSYHTQKSGSVSAPEVFLAYIGARTERIRLRTTSTVLLTFNHPVRVAERLATLDILTGGRAELGTARSNNLSTLEAFGLHPRETKRIWRESIGLITRTFTDDPFEHEGETWNFPARTLTPKPLQRPHPPIFVSASSAASHRGAGELGLGGMTGASILGWDYVAEAASAYHEGLAAATPLSPLVTESLGLYTTRVNCAATAAEAKDGVMGTALTFVELNIGPGGRYDQLAPTSPDYSYLGNVRDMQAHIHDLDYIMAASPYVLAGTPEFLIEQIERLESLGYTEFLMGIDGMGHEANSRAIEMIGRHVLPHFRERDAGADAGTAAREEVELA